MFSFTKLLLAFVFIGVVRRLHAYHLGEECSSVASCTPIPHIECRSVDDDAYKTCQCAAGFMQNATAEYIKQECVRVVAKTKSHGEPCTWGECLEEYVCRDGHCACPLQTPNFVPMTTACEGSSLNGSCYDSWWDEHDNSSDDDDENVPEYYRGYCVDFLECDEDVCVCGEYKPHWHETSSKCEAPYANEPCSYAAERCHNREESHLYCHYKNHNDRGTCVCAMDFPDWNAEERRCVQPRLGDNCAEKCTASMECVGKVCQCAKDTPVPDHETKTCSEKFKYEQPCTSNDCEADDLSCQNSVCLCKDTSLEFDGVSCGPRSVIKKSFGESCGGVGDICNAERGLVCEGGSCKCKAGNSWTQNMCQLDAKECNTQNDCDASKGLYCDVEARMCMCPQGKQPSKSGTCKLTVGETCYENRVLRHDLCASDLCIGEDTATVALAGRCACADFNGVKYTWSAEPKQGCVPDYVDLPCSGAKGDTECRSGDLRPKDALSCLKKNDGWFCACAEGKTYFQGFCVVATRSQGERCDPRGVDPTCNLDPNMTLVCEEAMCRCRNRAVTSADGNVDFSSTTWHADTKECELQRIGESCAANVQCQSGHCQLPGGQCQKAVKSGVGVMRRNVALLITYLCLII